MRRLNNKNTTNPGKKWVGRLLLFSEPLGTCGTRGRSHSTQAFRGETALGMGSLRCAGPCRPEGEYTQAPHKPRPHRAFTATEFRSPTDTWGLSRAVDVKSISSQLRFCWAGRGAPQQMELALDMPRTVLGLPMGLACSAVLWLQPRQVIFRARPSP